MANQSNTVRVIVLVIILFVSYFIGAWIGTAFLNGVTRLPGFIAAMIGLYIARSIGAWPDTDTDDPEQ